MAVRSDTPLRHLLAAIASPCCRLVLTLSGPHPRSVGGSLDLVILALRHDGLVEKIDLLLIDGGLPVFGGFVVLEALEYFDDDLVEQEFNQLPVRDHLMPQLVGEQHAVAEYGLEKLSLRHTQVLVPLGEVLVT